MMILAIIRTALVSLRRDRGALALSFILPVVFFSIFAVIFGGRRDTTPKVQHIVVDEDHSRASQRLVKGPAERRLAGRQNSARARQRRRTTRIHGSHRRSRGKSWNRARRPRHSARLRREPNLVRPARCQSPHHPDARRQQRHDCAPGRRRLAAEGRNDCHARRDGRTGLEIFRSVCRRPHQGAARSNRR